MEIRYVSFFFFPRTCRLRSSAASPLGRRPPARRRSSRRSVADRRCAPPPQVAAVDRRRRLSCVSRVLPSLSLPLFAATYPRLRPPSTVVCLPPTSSSTSDRRRRRGDRRRSPRQLPAPAPPRLSFSSTLSAATCTSARVDDSSLPPPVFAADRCPRQIACAAVVANVAGRWNSISSLSRARSLRLCTYASARPRPCSPATSPELMKVFVGERRR
jgi:hypothetical protein